MSTPRTEKVRKTLGETLESSELFFRNIGLDPGAALRASIANVLGLALDILATHVRGIEERVADLEQRK